MIWDANGIFSAYPEYLGRNIQREIFSGNDPFTNSVFKRITTPQEREKVWDNRPCVIVSSSGMLVGGPVITHLQNLAEDSRSTLLFTGYQGEGTMGRRIQKGWKEIPMKIENGKTIPLNLNMEIATIEGLSGHSSRNELLNFVDRLNSRPDKVICVHGDGPKTVDLARTIHKIFKMETCSPKNLESIRLR